VADLPVGVVDLLGTATPVLPDRARWAAAFTALAGFVAHLTQPLAARHHVVVLPEADTPASGPHLEVFLGADRTAASAAATAAASAADRTAASVAATAVGTANSLLWTTAWGCGWWHPQPVLYHSEAKPGRF
jgi:hypothetical protein